jgi:hypothetical protein
MLEIGVAMYTLERVEGFDPHVCHAKMGRRLSFSAHERNAKRCYLFLQRESVERKLNFGCLKERSSIEKTRKRAFYFVCPTYGGYQIE